MQDIAAVHNTLIEIKVSGDDVFRMGSAINNLRKIISELSNNEEMAAGKQD